MIRCVIVDAGTEVGALTEGIEVRVATDRLDLEPWAPHEVVLVSADPERLAVAGAAGINRLVVAGADTTAAALDELCRELDRP